MSAARELLPVSSGQRGLWFEQQADPSANAYNLAGCARFDAPVDPERVDAALALLAARHPAMRARFGLEANELASWRDDAPLRCQRFEAATQEEARALVAEALRRPYDLAAEHPYRFAVARVGGAGALLGIGCHHIVSDLHSVATVAQELGAAYASPSAQSLGPAPPPYADFVAQQREWLASDAGAQAARWWSERLAGVEAHDSLGDLESGSRGARAEGGRIDFAFGAQRSAALEAFAVRAEATPFVMLLTALQCLLARRLGESRVVVGAPSAGRNDRRFLGTVGYFVNLLPLCVEVREDEAFEALVARNAQDVRASLRHGQHPFGAMVRDLQRGGARDCAHLVQATLTFQKTVSGLAEPLTRLALGLPGGGLALGGAFGEIVPMPELRAQFPLGIAVASVAGGFAGHMSYEPARVAPEVAQGFLDDWIELVALAAAAPAATVGMLLERMERGEATDLSAALEDACARHAEREAVWFEGGALTYRELGERSAALAARLAAAGMGPGHRVAVLGAGGAETVCALVGVLRAGAAFVPMDADLDAARAQALLGAARIAALVACDGASPPSDSGVPVFEVFVDAPWATPDRPAISPLDPAWLMFTSGTTGAPKAAVVPHEAALAHARGMARRLGLSPRDRVLQFASLSFDEHAEEIFPTLLAGACVVCRPRVRFQDPEALLGAAAASRVTVLHLPTSYWHLWMDEAQNRALPFPPAVRVVNAGGEQASAARLRAWLKYAPPRARWVNSYGLTEAAVTSLVHEAGALAAASTSRIPAGRPLPGTRARIVRDDGADARDGETGELYLGGRGVGLGYFDNAEATAARFFRDGESRWLRTGDLALRDARGDIVIAGRRDRALKIRGMRIDPAEIEAALGRHPSVLECVVDAGGEGALEAGLDLYVAVRPGAAASEAQLLDFWRAELAGTPPPRRVAFCAGIPRTAGRKPDLAALRRSQPARESVEAAARAPSDALQETVGAAFGRVLQREAVDPGASFFSLGGHSLAAMRLVASLRHDLGVELAIGDLLAHPTIEGLAQVCRERGVHGAPAAPREDEASGAYPLARAQMRVMAMARAAGAPARATLALRIDGAVDAAKLQQAWAHALARHPLLWARITEGGNEERDGPPPAVLRRIAWAPRARTRAARARELREVFASEAQAGAPVAAAWLDGGPGYGFLVVEGSLLAIDGVSARSLLEDLARAYEHGETAAAPLRYRRFVAAECAWLASPARAAALAYWEEALRGAPAPTRLASRRAPAGDYATRRIRVALGARTRERLVALAQSRRTTPFVTLLAAFATLAARFSSSDEVLVGVPVSCSDVLGAGEAGGPTLNPIPFRLKVAEGEPFSSVLRRSRDALAASLAHAALPVEEIAACAPALRALRGEPMPVQFVAQDAGVGGGGAIRLRELFEREGIAPAEVMVGARIGERVEIHFEYRAGALRDAEAIAMARAYRVLLGALLAEPEGAALSARMLPRATLAERVRVRPAGAAAGTVLLQDGLEAAAREAPGRVALIHGAARLSFASLDRLANRHAVSLVAAGVAKGDRVAIVSRKGFAEIVAVLGALKAGAIYVPIAADMPSARAAALRARAGARVATGAGDGEAAALEEGVAFVPVDLRDDSPCEAPALERDPGQSAYILFTSGSTGAPKGVEVSHRAALLTVNEVLARFEIGEADVLYGLSALDFDLSVFDLFGAFIARAPLVLPSGEARADAFAWAGDVQTHGVTVWNSVPSSLEMLFEAAPRARFATVRRILVSGDWVGLGLPARARQAMPNATFIALGGATEAAIWSNCQVVDEVDPSWTSVPYGRALAGHSMFVAERGGWPAPAGVAGEILIGGGGLAKGYWGEPALTAKGFVEHPVAGGRVYRTGDLGRHFPDGSIEFLGRADRQLKVRGFRIEAGEVEAALAAHPSVQRVVVAAVGRGGARAPDTLVAYVVATDGTQADVEALRREAEARLPEYMRPALYCVLERLPLTANGKIDWNALPRPGDAAERFAEAALGELTGMERRVALLWRELLPHRMPRRDEDFFAAGGHSLLAVRLIARARDELGVELSLPRWLREPTIAHLARMAEARGGDGAAPGNDAAHSIAALRERVALDEDIRFTHRRAPGEGACLVTGAAGLIGRRLVAQLAARGVRDIVCVVRPGTEERARALLLDFLERRGIRAALRVVAGDLEQPRFGWSPAAFAEIAAQVGSVFHAGAALNLVAGYDALEPANVGGTREALRLAALAGAGFHHVSSIGVLPYGAGRRVLESDPIDGEGALLTGYCESKWVAEGIVRLALARGMHGAVYRPGLTLAEEDPAPAGGMISCVLQLASALGALPRLALALDVVGADYVAAAIVRLAFDPRADGGTFHLTHPEPVPLADLLQHARLAGMAVPLEDFAAWRARLEAMLPSIGDPRAAALGALIASQDERSITPADVDCSETVRLLEGSAVRCPPVREILAPLLLDAAPRAPALA